MTGRSKSGNDWQYAELKQLIRDQVAPDRDLGHIDRKKG